MGRRTYWNVTDSDPRIGRIRPYGGALAFLGLLLSACGGTADLTGPVEQALAAQVTTHLTGAMEAKAAAAPQLEAAPVDVPPPTLWEGTDGEVTFRVTQFKCQPVAFTDDGEPVEGVGKACWGDVEIHNAGSEDLRFSASNFVLTDSEGKEKLANGQSHIMFKSPAPANGAAMGAVEFGLVDWDRQFVTVTFKADREGEGVSFDLEDRHVPIW